MLYEEQIMDSSTSCSPTKQGHSHNSSPNSSYEKPLRCSWAEEVLKVEDAQCSKSKIRRTALTEESTNDCEKSQSREISLEFIEGVNEEKFERLVKEEKLKTPFKRRHSATHSNHSSKSRSDSPNSSNSDSDSKNCQKRFYNNHNEVKKRIRHSSSDSSSYIETDPAILSRRQKQIDYGKNTLAYERYIQTVSKSSRSRDHPHTPDKYGKYSRRAFDGLVKIWRKQLHYYDPPNENAGSANHSSDDSDSD